MMKLVWAVLIGAAVWLGYLVAVVNGMINAS